MDKSAASSFVYAKACGMLSKSFTGDNSRTLFSVKSLEELYGMLFDDEVPPLPEALLAREIENRAEEKFLQEMISLFNCYEKPDPLLVSMIRFFDYENLKEIAGSLCLNEEEMPQLADIKEFSMLNYEKFPDIKAITAKSPLSWYNKIPDIREQQLMDSRLDFQYLRELWNAVQKLPLSVREDGISFFKEEIVFSNILWALRLKFYYKMDDQLITEKLFFDNPKNLKSDVLAGPALRMLERDISSWETWKNWKYKSLLNPHEEGNVWTIDPRWIENKLNKIHLKSAYSLFHKYPDSVLVLVSFFRIKQNELDNIRFVTESLRLGDE